MNLLYHYFLIISLNVEQIRLVISILKLIDTYRINRLANKFLGFSPSLSVKTEQKRKPDRHF